MGQRSSKLAVTNAANSKINNASTMIKTSTIKMTGAGHPPSSSSVLLNPTNNGQQQLDEMNPHLLKEMKQQQQYQVKDIPYTEEDEKFDKAYSNTALHFRQQLISQEPGQTQNNRLPTDRTSRSSGSNDPLVLEPIPGRLTHRQLVQLLKQPNSNRSDLRLAFDLPTNQIVDDLFSSCQWPSSAETRTALEPESSSATNPSVDDRDQLPTVSWALEK